MNMIVNNVKNKLSYALPLLGLALSVGSLSGQSSIRGSQLPEEAKKHPYRFESFTPERWDASSFAPAKAVDAWRSARLGMFIHFGVSSLKGIELGWGRGKVQPPDNVQPGAIPFESMTTCIRISKSKTLMQKSGWELRNPQVFAI